MELVPFFIYEDRFVSEWKKMVGVEINEILCDIQYIIVVSYNGGIVYTYTIICSSYFLPAG